MTEFKVGDKVRIDARLEYDTALEPAVGRAGRVTRVGSNLMVEVEGEKITAYGVMKNEWWFPRSGVVLIDEETKEEKTMTKFVMGEKVRLLPGARSTTAGPEDRDKYAEGYREGVIGYDIDDDGDYFLLEVGYVSAEFIAKIEEFPRPIEFADVKIGDRISARREMFEGAFVTYEDTVVKIDSGEFTGKASYISGDDYTLTLLARPEPEFTAAQIAAVGALMKAGFSEKSAEEIVKKGDSA